MTISKFLFLNFQVVFEQRIIVDLLFNVKQLIFSNRKLLAIIHCCINKYLRFLTYNAFKIYHTASKNNYMAHTIKILHFYSQNLYFLLFFSELHRLMQIIKCTVSHILV